MHNTNKYDNIKIGGSMKNGYKNKNGFTLVELLAVVAILAILVALTMPNIMKEYNKVKVDSFVVDVQSVMDVAMSKYTGDALNNSGKTIYYSSKEVPGLETKKLDIDGGKKDYFIEMDRNGNFKRVIVYDDNYCYDVHSNYGNNSIGIIDGVKSEQYNEKISKTTVTAREVWLSGNDLMVPEVGTDETGQQYYNIMGCEGSQRVDLGKDNKSDIIINGEVVDEDDIDYEHIGLNEFDVELIVNNGTGGSKKEKVKYGTTVSWLVSPNEFYVTDNSTLTGDCVINGDRVSLTVKGDTTCTLEYMPAYECESGTLEYDETKGNICTISKPYSHSTSVPYTCGCYSTCMSYCPQYSYRTETYQCGTTSYCSSYDSKTGVCRSYSYSPRYCTRQVKYQTGSYCCGYGTAGCHTCYSSSPVYGSCPSGWSSYNSSKCYKPATRIEG